MSMIVIEAMEDASSCSIAVREIGIRCSALRRTPRLRSCCGRRQGRRPIPHSDGELFGVLRWPPIAEECGASALFESSAISLGRKFRGHDRRSVPSVEDRLLLFR